MVLCLVACYTCGTFLWPTLCRMCGYRMQM